ncbi:uncharacterized protein J3R85_000886 [Psidium guajava]|nr:uncharacterized protein J3R85_000886 [Psidium guajava]
METASFLFKSSKIWGLASKPLCYRKDSVRSLEGANEELKAVSEDVKARVEREEGGGGAQRTKQVDHWFGKVQKLKLE